MIAPTSIKPKPKADIIFGASSVLVETAGEPHRVGKSQRADLDDQPLIFDFIKIFDGTVKPLVAGEHVQDRLVAYLGIFTK